MERLGTGFEVKFASDAPDGSFSGYGSVFGNLDAYGDVIQKGAFKETIREAKKAGHLPPMLLEHGGGFFGATEDNLPIGLWTEMKEDDNGLFVEGRLALKTRRGAEVYELLRMEPKPALNGLSIGYRVKEAILGTKPGEPRRTIKKIELMEVSLVTMPANAKARTTNVKSIRDFEEWLRDVGGFSNARAKAIASRGFKPSEPRDEDDGRAGIVAAIKRGISILHPHA